MEEEKCVKVESKDHIAAYLEKRHLVRDTPPLECPQGLIDKLTSNYIIVKSILSNLSWQDQMICKLVCRMWCDAVRALQRELLEPQDFVVDIQDGVEGVMLKKSGTMASEPLAIFTFTNFAGFSKMTPCGSISPRPCTGICNDTHWIIDCIDQELCYPKECNLIIKASDLAYMPAPSSSITAPFTFTKETLHSSVPYLCGAVIPKITDVQYNVINIKANSDMKTEFFDIVDKMTETRVFKGFLVFVTDKYLLNSLDDIVFLNHFKEVQPDAPYALGGCIVEDAIYDRSDLCFFVNNVNDSSRSTFVSENVVSIAMFSVPKNSDGTVSNRGNFEMYSLVIESSDWAKAKIQKTVKEFAATVPRFEHSIVFKLTCVGRDERHEYEQNTFRASFPHTPLIGCYGNGELGLNNPPRPEPKAPLNTVKRQKRDMAQFGIMYSYSTVFVYCGWGRVLN